MTPAMSRALDMHQPPMYVKNPTPEQQAMEHALRIRRRSLSNPELYDKLFAFRSIFNRPTPEAPVMPTAEQLELVATLINEEFSELFKADTFKDLIDALGDIAYVCFDFLVAIGVDPDRLMQEIHASNMTKVDPATGPIIREDGKMLKNEATFIPPDFSVIVPSDLLEAQLPDWYWNQTAEEQN